MKEHVTTVNLEFSINSRQPGNAWLIAVLLSTAVVIVMALTLNLKPVLADTTPAATVDPNKSVYKIGAVVSRTGNNSALGVPEWNTAEMMEAQINAAGGINGHRVNIVLRDDTSSDVTVVTMTKELVDTENVLVVLGPTGSGPSLAIVDTVTKAQVPNISCAASIKIVTPIADRYWIFKTLQTEKQVVNEIYTYLQKKGITKVALITDTSAFGIAGRQILVSDASTYGIQVVDDQTFNIADASTESQLTHIHSTNAQVVINWSTDKQAAMVARDMKTLGMNLPLFCSHGVANPAFIQEAGSAANGVIFPAGKLLVLDSLPETDPQKIVIEEYKADYEAKYGANSTSTFGGHMYDAVAMVVLALKKMPEGLSTQDARVFLRNEIEKTSNFVGISGVFNMSATDHLGMSPGSLAMIKIVDGKWTLADPLSSTSTPTQTPAATIPAVGPVLTIDATIKELLDNPVANAVLRKCLGDALVDNPQLSAAFGMTLPTIAPMSGGLITDAMVACVKDGLAALASGARTAATIPVTTAPAATSSATNTLPPQTPGTVEGYSKPDPDSDPFWLWLSVLGGLALVAVVTRITYSRYSRRKQWEQQKAEIIEMIERETKGKNND